MKRTATLLAACTALTLVVAVQSAAAVRAPAVRASSVGPASAAPAAVQAVVPPGTQDVVVRTAANKNLSAAGGVETTIATMSLPAGSWVLTARASLVNFGPSDFGRCSIFRGPTALGGATAVIGDVNQAGSWPGTTVATLSMISSTVTTAAATTISLRCGHDTTLPGIPYVDASASLAAHRSTALVQLTQ